MTRLVPDTLIENGVIYTQNPAQPRVEALATLGGRVVAAGDRETIRELAGHGTKTIDLAGGTAIPGLVDAHVHFVSYGLSLSRVRLADTTSRAEAVARIAERAGRTPVGGWLTGRGWNRNAWDGQFPTAADLDMVTGDRPALFQSIDGHAGWANSLALRAANISTTTVDPPGGEIQRDAHGQPTGILFETAIRLVVDAMPQPNDDQLLAAAKAATDDVARHGLTGVYSMEDREARVPFARLRERGELKTRTTISIPVYRLDDAINLGLRAGQGDDWLRHGGLKIFADGALGPQTALMLEAYEGSDGRGIAVTSREDLFATIEKAARHGFYSVVHCIGDAANRHVLDAIAATRQQGVGPELRHRIEHAQIVHPDDLPRFAQLGVIASMQPNHATSDWKAADRYWGPRCRGTAYAWRTLKNLGAHLAFGTDCPVEPIDPIFNIWAAVTRRDKNGEPAGGWYPEERLTVAETIAAYTIGSAYADGLEHERGRLAGGYLADLTVLSADPYTIETETLRSLRVMMTIVGAQSVYQAS